jgi:hypothetical protein
MKSLIFTWTGMLSFASVSGCVALQMGLLHERFAAELANKVLFPLK